MIATIFWVGVLWWFFVGSKKKPPEGTETPAALPPPRNDSAVENPIGKLIAGTVVNALLKPRR